MDLASRVTLLALLTLAHDHGSVAKLVDLSHGFDNTTHFWTSSFRFNLTEEFKGWTDGYWYESNAFSSQEHGGTHIDSPNHFAEGGWTVDEIPVNHLIAHAALVDISARSSLDPDTALTVAELRAWQRSHGPWLYPTVVLVNTGYAAHWGNRTHYFGERPTEPGTRHFPGIGPEAAHYLAADPAVVGVGLDTASIDPGVDSTFQTHQILFRQNKFGLENLADMSDIPASGASGYWLDSVFPRTLGVVADEATVTALAGRADHPNPHGLKNCMGNLKDLITNSRIMALPMKITGGSGGPTRVVVDIPDQLSA